MSALAFNLLGALPQAAIIYMQAMLLPMRRRWLFVALEAALSCLALVLKQLPPDASSALGDVLTFAVALAAMLVLPTVFYSREISLAYRLAASALGTLLAWLAELSSGALWEMCGGVYDLDGLSALPAVPSAAIHLFFAAVVLIGGRLMREALARWGGTRLTKTGGALLCAMPVSQALLSWVMLIAMIEASPTDGRGLVLFGTAGLTLFCVLADVALLRAARRYHQTLEKRAHAETLENRMQAQLEAYEQLKVQIKSTASLRHDMRNHLLVLQALVRRAETERARAYTEEVLTELDGKR